jgi:hypothetical protein
MFMVFKDGNGLNPHVIRITRFTTFLLEYEYGFECSGIQIQNGCLEFGYTFGYLLDLEDNINQFSLLEICNYKIM